MDTDTFKKRICGLIISISICCFWLLGGFSYGSSKVGNRFDVSEISAQSKVVETKTSLTQKQGITLRRAEFPFAKFPITSIYRGKNAPLRLTREQNKFVGEKLRYTMKKSPKVNFAGRFIVANLSCGMWCQTSWIIDAKTGKVYSWDGLSSFCFPHLDTDFVCDENFQSIEYRMDSKLIVFFGSLDYGKDRGFHYYKFENGKFILLKSILVKEQRSTSEIMLDRADSKFESDKF